MEETNSAGLTFKQRVDAVNATGWTNHNSNYSFDVQIKPMLHALVWTLEMLVIIFGIYFIGYYLYNHYQAKRNK